MIQKIKMAKEGTITLPEYVVKALKLKTGSKININIENSSIILQKKDNVE